MARKVRREQRCARAQLTTLALIACAHACSRLHCCALTALPARPALLAWLFPPASSCRAADWPEGEDLRQEAPR